MNMLVTDTVVNTVQRPIKIWFTDMWAGFDFQDNYFTIYLSRYFNIKIDPQPDFLIHSVYSKNYLNYNCCRICITGENTRPDFSRSDYHIGFDYNDDPRYLRWPMFLMNRYVPEYLLKEKQVEQIFNDKKRFCSFVVSNSYASGRIEFFNKLNVYKQVASGGRYMNNIGGPVKDKHQFIKESKFNIAFENISYPGYTTEKIFDAFLGNCVPIYWGNTRIAEDFNEKAFVNVHSFTSFADAVDYVKYLDENDEAYKAVLGKSAFPENRIPEKFGIAKFIAFFNHIFNDFEKTKPVYKLANKVEYINYKLIKKMLALRMKIKQ